MPPSPNLSESHEDRIQRVEDLTAKASVSLATVTAYQKSSHKQLEELKETVEKGFQTITGAVTDLQRNVEARTTAVEIKVSALEAKDSRAERWKDPLRKAIIGILIAASTAIATNYFTASKPLAKAAVQAAQKAVVETMDN